MKTWTTVNGQLPIDLAIQLYGNCDAVAELLSLNNLTGRMSVSGGVNENEVDVSFPVKEGELITYDETSSLQNLSALRSIAQPGLALRNTIIATAQNLDEGVFDDTFAETFD